MSERLLYLGAAQPFLALYHAPDEPRGRHAVVLASPFGWDEIASHRALRDWALYLAARDHPVIRLDLPSLGDSPGGPTDPDIVSRWRAAIRHAIAFVRAESATETVVGIGIGLGGLLAYEAAAEGALDHIALWATPSRGRTLIRELSAFSALETARIVESGSPEPPPARMLAPGGFLLAPETTEALAAVDLATRPLPPGTRVLLLDRDGIKPDAGLQSAVTAAGAELTVASGDGFSAMLAEPDKSRTPVEVFDTVQAWLEDAPRRARMLPAVEPLRVAEELRLGGFHERPLAVPSESGRLAGISSLPDGESGPLAAVFLNAGAVRRIGPHRLWVDTARRWAGRGIPSLRLDLEGIGDSDGDAAPLANVAELYDPRFTTQVRAALDELERQGVGERFVVVGLCSGSSWAFQAALDDPRITTAIMVNPRILYWDEAIDIARDLRRTRLLVKPVIWKRIMRGDVSADRFAAFLGWSAKAPVRGLDHVRGRRRKASPTVELIADAFDRLRAQGTALRFIFCDGEPLHEEMSRDGLLSQPSRWPNVTTSLVPGRDHTLRPLWMHEHVDAALDAALESALAARAETRAAEVTAQSGELR